MREYVAEELESGDNAYVWVVAQRKGVDGRAGNVVGTAVFERYSGADSASRDVDLFSYVGVQDGKRDYRRKGVATTLVDAGKRELAAAAAGSDVNSYSTHLVTEVEPVSRGETANGISKAGRARFHERLGERIVAVRTGDGRLVAAPYFIPDQNNPSKTYKMDFYEVNTGELRTVGDVRSAIRTVHENGYEGINNTAVKRNAVAYGGFAKSAVTDSSPIKWVTPTELYGKKVSEAKK